MQKDTQKVKKSGESQVSVSRSRHLRKLHLVQIQQTQVTSRAKIELKDKVEQIDALTFAEENAKFVDFTRCLGKHGVPNFHAFLLAKERVKATGLLKLISIRIRWAPNELTQEEEDDDDQGDILEESKAQKSGAAKQSHEASRWKLRFDYATTCMPKIENFKHEKQKPSFLTVVEATEEVDQEADASRSIEQETVFYVYTGVGN